MRSVRKVTARSRRLLRVVATRPVRGQTHSGPSCALAGRVGADRRTRIDRRRCRRCMLPPAMVSDEAVEAAGRRARLLLADPVVLRAVARALEPLRRSGTTARGSRGARTSGTARRCPAPCPAMTGAYSDLLRRREVGLRVRLRRRCAACGHVERRLLASSIGRVMSATLAGVDLAAEAAGARSARGTPSSAAPKPATESRRIVTRMPRLRNCRRVTPSSSSSTGSQRGDVAARRAVAGSAARADRLRVSSARSRPVVSSSVDVDARRRRRRRRSLAGLALTRLA